MTNNHVAMRLLSNSKYREIGEGVHLFLHINKKFKNKKLFKVATKRKFALIVILH